MIKEFEFYHGIIFSKILHHLQGEITIKSYPSADNASYTINNTVGIYIKYCTKRMSPWGFSFNKNHKEEILEIFNRIGSVYLLLVCDDDGVVVLTYDEFNDVLGDASADIEWIRVMRNKGQMYSVAGSEGRLKCKIGKRDFPNKIFNLLNQ